MEILIVDILRVISTNISDNDFIHLVSTSEKLYNLRTSDLKVLTKQYDISKIISISKIYNFSDILYDLLEWRPDIIPSKIQKVTFIDEFNQNPSELFGFRHIKCINIGIFYTNDQLLKNNIPDTINKNELIATFITNKVFTCRSSVDIARLTETNLNKKFPMFLNELSIHKIMCRYSQKIMIQRFNESYLYSDHIQNIVSRINLHIDTTNQYESSLYFDNFGNVTITYFNFLMFYAKKMMENISKLEIKLLEKYKCKTLEEFFELLRDKK